MAPKRKRTEAATDEQTTESTPRRSTRGKAATENTVEPTAKKAKTPAKPKAPAKSKARKTSAEVPKPKNAAAELSEPATPATTKAKAAPAPERKSTSKKTVPYSSQAVDALFNEYADEDTPETIGPEGLERLCADGEIPLEGALPLILAWQLGSAEMGQFTRSEWRTGMGALQIADISVLKAALGDLEALLITPNGISAKPGSTPYSRDRYGQYAQNPKMAFKELYMFCFALAKPESSRVIDAEIACAFWSVLLAPRYPLIGEFVVHLQASGGLKAVTKDLWSMVNDFAQLVKPDLSDYEADGAWPSAIDEFVVSKKAQAA